MTDVTIIPGDNRDSLRRLADEGVQFDGVVTDPPYGLTSIVERFGGADAKTAKFGDNGTFQRVSSGFMHKQWDASEIERDPEFWSLVKDVMKPGAFCIAFSGSRTSHWQGVAMEQAGFVMHPMIAWIYSSGFPKGHCAALAVDRTLGKKPLDFGGERIPVTPEARDWEGWRFGTQTLKPAMEPIFVAQKPIDQKSVAKNLLTHGVGAQNIEALRVPFVSEKDQGSQKGAGRFPANVMHDGSDPVMAIFPEDKGDLTTSRYFSAFPMSHDIDATPFLYHPKASDEDRAGSKHPTVKPVGLIKALIELIAKPGSSILDPFAGSGTTAAAASQLGCTSTLMESDPDYLEFLSSRFSVDITTAQAETIEATVKGGDFYLDLLE